MTEPRKVILSANAAWNIYNFRKGLVRALQNAGYQIIALVPPDDYSYRLVDDLGCEFIQLEMDSKGTSPVRDLLLLWQYWRVLRRESPEVFLGFTIKPNIYGSLAAGVCGIPTINNISGLGTAFIHKGLLTRIVTLLYRLALRSSSMVFFQNADDYDLFLTRNLVRVEQTGILPGSGVDLEKFRPRQRQGKNDRAPCFLLIARMLWDKGVGEYVEAARLVRQDYPETRFQLLGFTGVANTTAIGSETIDRWVGEGVVEYLGTSDDVRPFIAEADCVVLPSYREGTPRSLLEAAAMARPLIATDVPGCREVVDEEGNGFLCQPRDVEDLARALRAFLALDPDQRDRMGRASRAKAESQFDEKIVINRYLKTVEAIRT